MGVPLELVLLEKLELDLLVKLAPLEVQPPLEVQLFLVPLEVQPSLEVQLFLAPLEVQQSLEAQLFLAQLEVQPSLEVQALELKGSKISNSVYWLEYSIASINEY